MSKLDELIRELCPDGVEYKRLEECCTLVKGKTPIQKAEPGEYPLVVTTSERRTCSTYQFDKPTVCIPLISSRGHGVASLNSVYYQEGKFALGNILCGVTPNDEDYLSAKFLFEYLNYKKDTLLVPLMKGGANVSMTVDSLKRVSVPVPPMQVQSEIVGILNGFTNLLMELTVELTARKTQYGYYRDKLLTPKDDVVVETLGNICRFVRGPFGGTLKKEIFKPTGYAVYEQQHAIYRKLEFRYYIDKQKYEELKRFAVRPGEMIVSCSGTIGKTFVIPENAPEGVINQALLKLTPTSRINVFYLQYFFDNTISKILNSVARGGAIKNVPSVEELKAIKIPIPTLEVQQRLVEVLDNFEKICSDLNIGLPAEIEARQKQYEYYRDKLLTFAETGNTILSRAEQSRAEQSRAEQSRAEQSRALIKLLQYVFGYAVVTLEDIAENCDSMRKPVTSGKREAGEYPYYGASGIVDYVKDYIFDGDYLLVSEDGANLLARSTPIAFSISGKNWVNNHAHVLKFDCYETRRFVEFYLNSIDLAPYISGGAQPKLNQKNLNRIEIPLPSQERQKYIVDILDRFDAICNDLTSGLPAEIEARQKQYEYYRDKLLSFKERL